ncbi:MAG: FtsX-like permease family protein [Peptostreptococcus porci]|uniref:FtsX-like permease family protein n=1 Tax=Peptostreptococcus porci TaxID=2652282 RepID=UPI002A91E335|nr:FtsX-like permease family protein [Peptostreptococcus porci]MDY5478874.1 FtsX-like permease family protein [Peptostreptococcus porci]
MKKSVLNKDIKKSIMSSWGRFFSIFFLMAIGSFSLVGLKVASPDMLRTTQRYFNEQNLADITIISNYGITKDDVLEIEKSKGTEYVEFGYMKDVTIKESDFSVRIFSNTSKVSKYFVESGRLPKKLNEVALDVSQSTDYDIGDTIEFEEAGDLDGKKSLKRDKYKVVGFVKSPEILSAVNKGQTTVGTGELNGFAVVQDGNFSTDYYMLARITYKDVSGLDPYSTEYKDKIELHKNDLSKILKNQPDKRIIEIKREYNNKIDTAEKKLEESKKKISDAEKQLEEARIQLDSGKQKISDSEIDMQKEIKLAEAQIKSAEEELNKKESEMNTTLAEKAKLLQEKEDEYNKVYSLYSGGKILANAEENSLKNKLENTNSLLLGKLLEDKISDVSGINNALDSAGDQLQNSRQQLDAAQNSYIEAKSSAQSQLSVKKNELENAKKALITKEADGKKKLEASKKELAKKEEEYSSKKKEFEAKKSEFEKKIKSGQNDIDDAKKLVDKLDTPQYDVDTRRETPGSEGYKIYSNIGRIINSLANIFPVFLYFVAALVTFTTMTRFVDEERINMGTLKGLGYTDKEIMKKFTVYGFVSSISGTVFGIFLGHTLLPMIVYNTYKTGFVVPHIQLHFYWKISLVSIVLSMISAVLPAYLVARKELKGEATNLLLPKPPANGSKIFLEKIDLIWEKLNFTQKVTARNIFRYKKRMLMTIFGVAGAVTLLFTGFGVKNSISGINERQFNDILHYDLIVLQNNYITDKQKSAIENKLDSSKIKDSSEIYYEEVHKSFGKNNDDQEIKVIVPENNSDFNNFITLYEKNGKDRISLDDEGVVISKRLADVLKIEQGDTIRVKDKENNTKKIKVSGVCEMYMGHFIFMDKASYQKYFDKKFESNSRLVILEDNSLKNAEKMASEFIGINGIKSVVQNTSLVNLINTIVKSLDKIMMVLIVVAVFLSVVIIFNLTNINISERIRELSTIKVLGFFDKEVTLYIYRETILLSLIGLIVGYGFGNILHKYILFTVPPDDVMFSSFSGLVSYILPLIIIAIVIFVVGVFENRKMKNVDMLEALKSVE